MPKLAHSSEVVQNTSSLIFGSLDDPLIVILGGTVAVLRLSGKLSFVYTSHVKLTVRT